MTQDQHEPRAVRVEGVSIAAMSTVGTAHGIDVETGERVTFAGDQRPLREIGAAVEVAQTADELPVAEVARYQVLRVEEVPA